MIRILLFRVLYSGPLFSGKGGAFGVRDMGFGVPVQVRISF